MAKSFKLRATVSSSSPVLIEPVIRKLFPKGSVKREGEDFIVETQLEGESAKDLNREILSELRRTEKKTRLRAEWTNGGVTERYFDYVMKKRIVDSK